MQDQSSEPFRLKALPTLSGLFIALGIFFLAFISADLLKLIHLPERPEMPWLLDSYYNIILFAYAYFGIVLMRRRHPGAYGFRWPEGRSFVLGAIGVGLIFGCLLTLADFWPQVAYMRRLNQPYPLTPLNIGGWIVFDGLIMGTAKETLFRGLLMSYLAQWMPGRIVIRGVAISGAGVIAAAIYAYMELLYGETFFVKSLPEILAQLLVCFVLGIFFAIWFERSKSLLAPIVGHSVARLTEQALVFAMVATIH